MTCLRVCFLKSGKKYYNHFTIHVLKSKIIPNVVANIQDFEVIFVSHLRASDIKLSRGAISTRPQLELGE